ncbi:hypothetical protein Taro_013596 [Colocasia esculenta]|uniref:Uncharacterized protein n=1 Tax=Colocasia esculenta TaxID=4460 RepID=A0A843U6Z1_COLES|nr:hypothetical protein [Colocasia esculenta]
MKDQTCTSPAQATHPHHTFHTTNSHWPYNGRHNHNTHDPHGSEKHATLQLGWAASHGSTQSRWYLCEQGRFSTGLRSPPCSPSRHTAHSLADESVLPSAGAAAASVGGRGFLVRAAELVLVTAAPPLAGAPLRAGGARDSAPS